MRFFQSFREKDPIYFAWKVHDRVQPLIVSGHFRWPVLKRPQLTAFELTPEDDVTAELISTTELYRLPDSPEVREFV